MTDVPLTPLAMILFHMADMTPLPRKRVHGKSEAAAAKRKRTTSYYYDANPFTYYHSIKSNIARQERRANDMLTKNKRDKTAAEMLETCRRRREIIAKVQHDYEQRSFEFLDSNEYPLESSEVKHALSAIMREVSAVHGLPTNYGLERTE